MKCMEDYFVGNFERLPADSRNTNVAYGQTKSFILDIVVLPRSGRGTFLQVLSSDMHFARL